MLKAAQLAAAKAAVAKTKTILYTKKNTCNKRIHDVYCYGPSI